MGIIRGGAENGKIPDTRAAMAEFSSVISISPHKLQSETAGSRAKHGREVGRYLVQKARRLLSRVAGNVAKKRHEVNPAGNSGAVWQMATARWLF